ncbi:MAG: Asp-tRNA(Asn)/Glu-tRNA(Gln) amidotransferase subunit GatC, partial [Balneolales bacterium]
MSVTKKDVMYMANLARLRFTGEEADGLVKDMNQILGYMELLNKVDTSDVEPLDHVSDILPRYRPDEAKEPLNHDDALKNAPDADTDYFRVP